MMSVSEPARKLSYSSSLMPMWSMTLSWVMKDRRPASLSVEVTTRKSSACTKEV